MVLLKSSSRFGELLLLGLPSNFNQLSRPPFAFHDNVRPLTTGRQKLIRIDLDLLRGRERLERLGRTIENLFGMVNPELSARRPESLVIGLQFILRPF